MIEIQTPAQLIPSGLVAKLGAKQLTQLAKNLADAARDKWIRLAQGDSQYGKHMRHDYIRGIQKPVAMHGTAVIALVGSVANIMEHGDSGQDMRKTHLGPQVPVVPQGQRGKHEALEGGFYRAIPFRHATPGAGGGVVGQEMGSAYSGHQAVADAKKLGQEVYAEARGLPATTSQPSLGARYGGRLEAGLAPKLRDHHKTDIYAGMIREEKVYEEAVQSQYMTFRTISTHVTDDEGNRERAEEGWYRRPIPPRNYAIQVADYVTKIAADAATAMLERQ